MRPIFKRSTQEPPSHVRVVFDNRPARQFGVAEFQGSLADFDAIQVRVQAAEGLANISTNDLIAELGRRSERA